MAPVKEITAKVKLQIEAGKANPAPPIGPALGQHGINIAEFCKQYNDKTKTRMGEVVPVIITVYKDRSFTLELKTPPVSFLLLKAAKAEKGSGQPNKTKVGKVDQASLRKIAEVKMVDLNATSIEAAMKIVAGSARSMGIDVLDK
jgi:large subunit ribosomal protein L11